MLIPSSPRVDCGGDVSKQPLGAGREVQAEGSYGSRIMVVGKINCYSGAGIERREAAEGILCFPACVSVSIGVRA